MRGRAPTVIATLAGEIDLANADVGEELILAGVPSEADRLILDLSEVAYLDSAGIRLILGVNERLQDRLKMTRRQPMSLGKRLRGNRLPPGMDCNVDDSGHGK